MGSVIYKGLLCLLAREGAKDFGGGGPLTVDLCLGTRQDVHHIYPTAALGAIAKADRWADSIANKTLVNAALNRSIGGRKPSEYLAILHKNAPERDFAEILATHQVDFATLARNDWTNYIKDRRERLRQLIAKVCGGNVLPFSDMPSPEPDDGEA